MPTLPDTLAATRVHGTVCFSGILSNEWIVPNFYPIDYLPKGVRLTAYGGDSADLPADVLQRYLDKIAAGQLNLGPTITYRYADIRTAHADMELNRAVGKLVVRVLMADHRSNGVGGGAWESNPPSTRKLAEQPF